MKPSYQRLESLDVLRGFDLFCLVALEGVLHPLGRAIDAPFGITIFCGASRMCSGRGSLRGTW